MSRLACLALALGCVACGSPSYTVVDASYGQLAALAPMPEPTGPADLVDTLAAARAAWADAGVESQPYVPYVRYVANDDIDTECAYPEGTPVLGCWAPWARGGILMAEKMSTRADLLLVMTHELGHAIRGKGGHLPCPSKGDSLMCVSGYGEAEPTEQDVAFVLGETAAL